MGKIFAGGLGWAHPEVVRLLALARRYRHEANRWSKRLTRLFGSCNQRLIEEREPAVHQSLKGRWAAEWRFSQEARLLAEGILRDQAFTVDLKPHDEKVLSESMDYWGIHLANDGGNWCAVYPVGAGSYRAVPLSQATYRVAVGEMERWNNESPKVGATPLLDEIRDALWSV